jgi:hypothetical protein
MMKTELPSWLVVGAIVKGIGFVGIVEDIMYSDSGRVVIKVSSPKSARLWQKTDLLDYTEAPDVWEQASKEDLRREARDEIERSRKQVESTEKYMRDKGFAP